MVSRAGENEGEAVLEARETSTKSQSELAWEAMEAANKLRDLGPVDEAEAAYREIIALHPSFSHAYFALGHLLRKSGRSEEALAAFRASAERASDLAWYPMEAANELRNLGRLDEAETAYRAVTLQYPSFPHAYFSLGHLLRKSGRNEEALTAFRASAEHAPELAWHAMEAANELRNLGLLDQAEAAYHDVADRYPAFPHASFALGHLLRKSGRNAEALAAFRTSAERAPELAWHAMEAANELRNLGCLDDAEAAYHDVADRYPAFPHASFALGHLLRKSGRNEEALAAFRASAERAPELAWHAMEAANELRNLGRLDEAERAYRSVIARHPDFPHAPTALGLLLKKSGRSEEAVACLLDALTLWPEDVGVLRETAMTLHELNRSTEAETHCQTFIDANPQSVGAILVYVDLLRAAGKREEAAILIERAVSIDPENVQSQLGLAGEYANAGRFAEAVTIYNRIIASEPQNCWAWLGKGQLARRQGFRGEALACFQKAATCTPTTEWAAVELAKELSDARRFREAESALAPLGASSGELDVHLQKGRIARQEGDFAKAREIYSRRTQTSPPNARVMLELATELFRCGKIDDAATMLKQAAVLEPKNSEALLALGNFAQSTGELTVAERIFRKAATLDPSRSWPLLSLARCLAYFGRLDEAVQLIRRVDKRFGRLAEAYQAEGAIFKESGDYHEADRIFAEGVVAFPHNVELWLQHLLMRIMLGDFAVAEIMLRSPPQCSLAEQARVLVAKGLLAETKWDIGAAYDHFVAALNVNDSDSWIHHCAANVALLQNDIAAVEKHLKGHLRTNVLHGAAVGRRNISQTHVGQLLDELRIDLAAFNRLAESLLASDSDAIAPVIREYPDYTPAAIALFVALRREGKLTTLKEAWRECRPANAIPRSIVQFWSDEQPPADIAQYCASWSRFNPDFSYRLFSKSEARGFIADHCPKIVLAAFDRASSPAMKADLFRLAHLFVRGGFYADADDRCVGPLMTIMPPDRRLIVYQEEFGSAGNNIIGAAPEHPVIGQALQEAALAIMRGDNDLVWLSTGPGLLTRCFARYLAQQGSFDAELSQTLILERHELYRVAALHCQAQYKHSHHHWSRSAFFAKQSNRREQVDFLAWLGPDLPEDDGAQAARGEPESEAAP